MTDLFQLQPDVHYSIITGHSENGNQFLAAYGGTTGHGFFFTVLFDRIGNLIEFREWDYAGMSMDVLPEAVGMGYIEFLRRELCDDTLELDAIHVESFFLEEKAIGITRLPLDMEHFISHESEFTEEQKDDYRYEIKEWLESGKFVLHLGHNDDFWCDEDGEIVAS